MTQYGAQPTEVEGAQPFGTCLRIHGADDGRLDIQRGRNDKGKSQHRIDKPRLQYVPTGANREIPIKFNYNTINRISNNYHCKIMAKSSLLNEKIVVTLHS